MAGSEGKDGTARKPRPPSKPKRPRDKRHLDDLLDEALDETFPASDAIELTPEAE